VGGSAVNEHQWGQIAASPGTQVYLAIINADIGMLGLLG
jgi:hypothetical protein